VPRRWRWSRSSEERPLLLARKFLLYALLWDEMLLTACTVCLYRSTTTAWPCRNWRGLRNACLGGNVNQRRCSTVLHGVLPSWQASPCAWYVKLVILNLLFLNENPHVCLVHPKEVILLPVPCPYILCMPVKYTSILPANAFIDKQAWQEC
jgi:hypothetical protein